MDDSSSIGSEERPRASFNETRTQPNSAFNQFSSAVRNVYPEQFDGNVSIRRAYKKINKIRELIILRTKLQVLGIVSIVIGLISGLAGLGAEWSSWIANAQLGLTIAELLLFSVGLGSVGYAEFGLRKEIKSQIAGLERITTDSLTHRTLYFGSAQYSIRLGDEGLQYSANRLSAYVSYWAIDLEKFLKANSMPSIDVAPFRDARLSDVKSGRAEGDEFKEFFKAITHWFVHDAKPTSILLPLVTEGGWLDPKFEEQARQSKSDKNRGRKPSQPVELVSETLVIPLEPFASNRDSDINPVEFAICLYFAIRRAHLDRIKMRVRKPDDGSGAI